MTRLFRVFRPAAMLAIVIAGSCAAAAALAAPVGSNFTYQGKLQKDAAPYTGTADMLFRLHDDAAAGIQVGADVTLAGVTLTEGLFTVDLDFGNVFDGTALWLEVQVLTPGDADYTALLPRQQLAATPYAMHALSAPGGGGGGGQWTSDIYGITHPGNVGIGAGSRSDRKLFIDAGALGNPLWVKNSNANYAALAIQNSAANGYGIHDDTSTRHYLAGRLGLGVLSPFTYSKLDVNGVGQGIRVQVTGSAFNPQYNAALVGLGFTGATGSAAMGLYASSSDSRAVWGISVSDLGVVGDCQSAGNSGWLGGLTEGVYGQATNAARYGGRFYNSAAGGVALRADGLAQVKTLQILGADLAESFPIKEQDVEPGTVLMLDGTPDGGLRVADEAYCSRVAGVVSGANGLDAAIVLKGQRYDTVGHAAVALTGRVWVKCDATGAPIAVGDLLTTAARAGYAMKAADRDRSPGAVLGKAMTALDSGTGLVLVLVSLQ